MSRVRVTRTELYDLVWTTPIRRLAVQFGVSDVALAKTCARMNVPRPGRGYWARLAAGAKMKRAALPNDPKAEQAWVFGQRDEDAPPPAPRPEAPQVKVARNLRKANEVVRLSVPARDRGDLTKSPLNDRSASSMTSWPPTG